MSGKNLKTLADQLWKNHGVSLIPTFDSSIAPGSVLLRTDWNRIGHIGNISSIIPAAQLPPVVGPSPCMLADFKRSHELNIDAAIELLGAPASVGGQFQRAADAAATFDSPVTYAMDLLRLEDVIESQGKKFWNSALGQKLQERKTSKDTRIVFQTIRGRLSFVFRDSGGVGVDLKSGPLGDLSKVGLKAGWRWRNEATLESKKELVIAVDYAWYDKRREMFREDKR